MDAAAHDLAGREDPLERHDASVGHPAEYRRGPTSVEPDPIVRTCVFAQVVI